MQIVATIKAYERTKFYDLAAATPLLAFYALGVWNLGAQAVRLAGEQIGSGGDARLVLLANVLLKLAFATLIVWLLMVRRVPQAKLPGLIPRFAAVAGTFSGIVLTVLPVAPLSLSAMLLTMIPITIGLAGSLFVLAWLGRQFSIMPEARKLVSSGPYALVRHPLYLFELIAFSGLMLQHVQPWAAILFSAVCTLQFVRMIYEERVLASAFPEYADYAARTPRIVPCIRRRVAGRARQSA